jgi:archaemetzincin
MRRRTFLAGALGATLGTCKAGGRSPPSPSLKDLPRKLAPLQAPLEKPKPGDWLASHPEPGQSFDEYVRSGPIRPVGARRNLDVQPLGDLGPAERRIVAAAAEHSLSP